MARPTHDQGTAAAILAAASKLLEEGGVDALTTRAVCAAAGVTAPTVYHHFGDKDGLAAALVARGIDDFVRRKRASAGGGDALAELRRGWDDALDFAIRQPALYRLMVEHARRRPELAAEAFALLRQRLARLDEAGRLRVPVDAATHAVWAASSGLPSLLGQGVATRDVRAASDLLFEALRARLIAPG